LHHKEIHISDRKSRSKEQTGKDRRKSKRAETKKKAVSKTAQDRSQKNTVYLRDEA
jgi:hypothetical protein